MPYPSHLNFFVPDSRTSAGRELILKKINVIYDEQFDISYYIKGITWQDTENMAIFERREIYNRLLKRKNEEKEASEEAMKEAKRHRNAISVSNTPKRPRRIRR